MHNKVFDCTRWVAAAASLSRTIQQLDPETLAEVRTAINGKLVMGRSIQSGNRNNARPVSTTRAAWAPEETACDLATARKNNEQRSFVERL